jgi:MFS family permease
VALQKYYKQSIINLFHGVWSLAGLVGAGAGLLFIAGSVTISWHFIIASCVALSLVFSMYSSSLKFQQKGLVSKTLIWSDKSLWLLGSMSFCSMWCEGAMNDWSSLYMAREGGVDEKWMTAGYVSYLALMVSGRLVGDKLVNLWGVKNLLFYSGILAASGITLAVLWPSFITILIGFSAVGLGVSCVVPMVLLTASQQHPISAAGAIATISTIGYMGFLSASPVTGFISQHFGLRWAYAICGLLTLALSMLVMKRGEGPKVQAAHA